MQPASSRLNGTAKGVTSAYFWNRTLTFRMPRIVVIQIWELGLLNIVLQLCVLAYALSTALSPSLWSITEGPTNIINAWVEGGKVAAGWAVASSIGSTYAYCNETARSNYDYVYSAEFNYSNARCEVAHAWEVAQKLPGAVVVSTVFLDTIEEGWDCGASDAATKAAACTVDGGTLGRIFGTQCLCTTIKTTYPVGVEDMVVAFDHTVQTTDQMDNLEGRASVNDDSLLETTVKFSDGSSRAFASGSVISLSLGDWMRATGVDLDQRNTHVAPDATDGSSYPFFRTTGVTILVDIEYTNVKQGKTEPEYAFHKELRATAVPTVDEGWAGLGVKAPIYDSIPTNGGAAQTYRKLLRYSQGVVFKFKSKGFVYRIDTTALLALFTNSIVLLGLTSSVTAFVAKNLWRDRQMILNKSEEHLAVGTRLTEIAVKALSYAATFANLERTGDGKVTSDDLVTVFEKAGAPFSKDEAQTIATMIICRSNDDDPAAGALDDLQEMDYVEFANGMEGGSSLSIGEFRKAIERFSGKKSAALPGLHGVSKNAVLPIPAAASPPRAMVGPHAA